MKLHLSPLVFCIEMFVRMIRSWREVCREISTVCLMEGRGGGKGRGNTIISITIIIKTDDMG